MRQRSIISALGFTVAAAAIISALDASAFALTSVVSRKVHAGIVGNADRVLDRTAAIDGAVTVESRAIDAGHSIVFQFDGAVNSIGGASVIGTDGLATGIATPQLSGNTVNVTLSNVSDIRRATILLSGVNGSLNTQASVGFLLGDTDNSYHVDVGDSRAVKARSGQPVSSAANNFAFDLNGSGRINAADIVAAKSRNGDSLAALQPSPTVSIIGSTRVVADKLYFYGATVSSGTASTYSWAWGDGSNTAAGSPARKVWNKPGVFSASARATVNGSVYAGTQTTNVVGEPISAGNYHTCALKPDSSVACWGRNNWGQLGDDSGVNQPAPVAVTGLSNVVALSAGADHTCALKSDTSVVCWGRNEDGQLGDGSVLSKPTPVAVSGLSGVVSLKSTHYHTCAIKTDSSVVCWGYNFYGQLGDGTLIAKSSPVAVIGLTGAVALATGGHHTCALKTDGSVACWGERGYGQMGDGNIDLNQLTPSVVPGLSGAVSLAAGYAANFVIKSDGSVIFWGTLNSHLGNGTSIFNSPPTAVDGLSGVIAMGVGEDQICVLKDDASLACWGYNFYGQLGNGNTAFTTTPTSPLLTSTDLSDVVALTGGNTHTCALKADGTAVCWGANVVGELGNGNALGFIYNPLPVTGGAVYWK